MVIDVDPVVARVDLGWLRRDEFVDRFRLGGHTVDGAKERVGVWPGRCRPGLTQKLPVPPTVRTRGREVQVVLLSARNEPASLAIQHPLLALLLDPFGIIFELLLAIGQKAVAEEAADSEPPRQYGRAYNWVQEDEADRIRAMLSQTNNNQSEAARRLNISLRQLRYRVDKLGIGRN